MLACVPIKKLSQLKKKRKEPYWPSYLLPHRPQKNRKHAGLWLEVNKSSIVSISGSRLWAFLSYKKYLLVFQELRWGFQHFYVIIRDINFSSGKENSKVRKEKSWVPIIVTLHALTIEHCHLHIPSPSPFSGRMWDKKSRVELEYREEQTQV